MACLQRCRACRVAGRRSGRRRRRDRDRRGPRRAVRGRRASQRKQRSASARAVASSNPTWVAANEPGWIIGSGACARGRVARSSVRVTLGRRGGSGRSRGCPRSPSAAPLRYSWIEAAARRPDATASMIVFGPDTTSPPAKMPARPVASVRGSATMPAQPLTSMPAPFGQDRRVGLLADGDEDRRRGEFVLGAGDRLPGGPRSPAAGGAAGAGRVSTQRMPTTAPSRPTTSTGARPVRTMIPSRSAASISSTWAGISARPRR